MKKIRTICLLVCAVILVQLLGLSVFAQTDSSVTSGCYSTNAARPLDGSEKMLETSKAVILYERNSDTLIYAYNADETIYPSSMVKLMTAIVALERGQLSSVATVTRDALNQVAIGSVSAGLQAGEEITLEALLYCMMAASANDAAVVIAQHIAGSQEGFVQMMNDKARELGCTGTNFTNVHGLHDDNTYTTARDICKILDVALDNEQFRTLFEAKTYTVPATNKSEERFITTTNYMMSKDYTSKYFDERVTGGKTGATDEAGRCLAITAEANGMEMLAIVMGAEPTYEEEGIILKTFGSYEEMKVLLDYASEKFEYCQVFYENQTLSQYPVSGGSNNVVTTPASSLAAVLPVDYDDQQLRWVHGEVTGTLTAPVEEGQKISYIEVWYRDLCIARTDLVALNAVDVYQAPTEPDRNAAQEEDDGGAIIAIVIGVLLGIGVLVIVIMLAVNAVRAAANRARRRRRRRNMRRSR